MMHEALHDKNFYFLEKDYSIIIELIVFELSYASWVNNIYWPHLISKGKAELDLDQLIGGAI
jgi:hypothetical protein